MNHPRLQRSNRARTKTRDTEAIDLMKNAFVCVSIPIAAFAIAYITLDTFVRLFLG